MIELQGATKVFDAGGGVDGATVTALSDVSLEVGRGRIVGLLGHNGAGKTTLIRLIAGLLAPDAGTVRFQGRDPVVDGSWVRARLGILPSSALLDERLTARENLRFAGRLFGLDRTDVDTRVARALEHFDLQTRIDDKVSGFSLGMKQRLALARVLLPEPEALLLDEPSSAVDPVATREIRQLITTEARERGVAVLLATHDLDEAGNLCDEVLILREGRALVQGPLDRVAAQMKVAATLIVRCAPAQTGQARELVATVDPTATVAGPGRVDGHGMVPARVPELVRLLAADGIDVFGVDMKGPSLEDLYFHIHSADGQRAESSSGLVRLQPPPDPVEAGR